MRKVYYRDGQINPQAQPICVRCNDCQTTVIEDNLSDGAGKGLVYRSEADARQTWTVLGPQILAKYQPQFWSTAWAQFECKNKGCIHPSPCLPARPTYIEVGVNRIADPKVKGSFLWFFFMHLERKIQCLAAGGGVDVEVIVPRTIPEPLPDDEPAPPSPPQDEPKPHEDPSDLTSEPAPDELDAPPIVLPRPGDA